MTCNLLFLSTQFYPLLFIWPLHFELHRSIYVSLFFCHSLFLLPSWTAPGHTTSLTNMSEGGRVGKWGTWEFLFFLSFSSFSSTSDITSSDAHLSSKHSLRTTLMDMNKFVLVEVVCMCQWITNNVTGNNFSVPVIALPAHLCCRHLQLIAPFWWTEHFISCLHKYPCSPTSYIQTLTIHRSACSVNRTVNKVRCTLHTSSECHMEKLLNPTATRCIAVIYPWDHMDFSNDINYGAVKEWSALKIHYGAGRLWQASYRNICTQRAVCRNMWFCVCLRKSETFFSRAETWIWDYMWALLTAVRWMPLTSVLSQVYFLTSSDVYAEGLSNIGKCSTADIRLASMWVG